MLQEHRRKAQMSIEAELKHKLGIRPRPGETSKEFSKRVYRKITPLTDRKWLSLSPAVQSWYNAFCIVEDLSFFRPPAEIRREIKRFSKFRSRRNETPLRFIRRVALLKVRRRRKLNVSR
jgi:hypothetical protein